MIRRSNLYLFIFLGIFSSLVLVGGLLSPLLLHFIRSTYLSMSTMVHQHEAEMFGRFISKLIEEGESKEKVIDAFQHSLNNTEMYRGYLYLVNENTGVFLAHPDRNFVGKNAGELDADFLPINDHKAMKWSTAMKEKKVTQGGMLKMPTGSVEIFNSFLVPSTEFRVFSHENLNRLNREIAKLQRITILIFILLGFLIALPASYAALKVSRRYERTIEEEQDKSERLLLNILPLSIAMRLKAQETNIANRYEDVSILFVDIVDFTLLAAKMSPEQLVEILSYVFSQFDAISVRHGLEKIKTMGDAYMVAGGVPEFNENHLKCCIEAGFQMMEFIAKEFKADIQLHVRMGLHVGPVVAGVIGTHKFTYDLWGETVNVASRLESTGTPGFIHCSEMVYQRMKNEYKFLTEKKIVLKGMGEVSTYFLAPRES